MSARRVLVVDDDRDVAEALADLLTHHGHSVEVAYLGRTALVAAERGTHDAVLVDIGLPDIAGTDVAKQIAQLRPGIQCFLMTGYSSHDISARSLDTGAIEVLVKPFDTADLIRRIEAGGAA